jgi:hypothetical protein
MTTPLNHVVPWGRSLSEYRQMFRLSDDDLKLNILGCGDGPASFNAEMTALGCRVVSVDPIYQYSAKQIDGRIQEASATVAEHLALARNRYNWDFFRDIPHLVEHRMSTMRRFIADFEAGKREGRYLPDSLPRLGFKDGEFDLALCSHFLFLYSDQFSLEFHRESALELCRVAREVRIFPLVTLASTPSPYLDPVCEALSAAGLEAEIVNVPVLFERNADAMLRIVRPATPAP